MSAFSPFPNIILDSAHASDSAMMKYIQLQMTITTSTDLQPNDQVRLNLTEGHTVADANWNSDCTLEANDPVDYRCYLQD